MRFFAGLLRAVILCALFLLVLNFKAGAQNAFKKHVFFLASDSMHGRGPGTVDELKAANYISSFLAKDCSAQVTFQKFDYTNQQGVHVYATNVIGKIDKHKTKTLILSAHYDHLGTGSPKSLDLLHKTGLYPGADDNASGVAMVMELTRFLATQKKLPFNVIAFFSSGHEDGLFGARFFSQSGYTDSAHLMLIMNFDMVGRLDTSSKILRVGAFSSDSDLMSFFIGHDTNALHFRMDDSDIDYSDLKYFEPLHISMLHFTTGTHQDYHRTTDVVSKINFEGMDTIFTTMKSLLNDIIKKN